MRSLTEAAERLADLDHRTAREMRREQAAAEHDIDPMVRRLHRDREMRDRPVGE